MITDQIRNFLRRAVPLAALLFVVSARATAQSSTSWTGGCASVANNTVGNVIWTPALCQEFNSSTAGPPDTTAWSFDLGTGGFGNNELETYCGPPGTAGNPPACPTTFDTTTANSFVDGSGHLIVQITDVGGTWYSARLKTQGTQAFQYGRIESSIELPDLTNPGLWPAFWWLGTDITSNPWPACGESDIMEAWAAATTCGAPAGNTTNHSTIHYGPSSSSEASKGEPYTFPAGEQMNTAFYAYGVIWSANMLQYYVNPPTPASLSTSTLQPFFIVTASDVQSGAIWPYNIASTMTGPVFLLLNVAVGGTCGGTLPAGSGPYQMMVDYVRDYSASTIPAPNLGTPPSITVAAGATAGNTSTLSPALTAGTGYVYFSCDTTAPKATCAIKTTDPLDQYVVNSDASPAESVTVTVATTSNAVLVPAIFNRPAARPILLLLAAVMAIVIFGRKPSRHAKRASAAAFAALVLPALLMWSCGGGSSSVNVNNPPPNGTTPGSYTVSVYAFTEGNTSNGANASADAKVSIPLTVQ